MKNQEFVPPRPLSFETKLRHIMLRDLLTQKSCTKNVDSENQIENRLPSLPQNMILIHKMFEKLFTIAKNELSSSLFSDPIARPVASSTLRPAVVRRSPSKILS
jgi:hypothetical protein